MIRQTISLFTLVLSILFTPSIHAQQVVLKGIVIDFNSNAALAGVSVLQTGTQFGTKTDNNGNFSIQVPVNSTITLTAIGYADTTLEVGNKTFLRIALTHQSQVLNNVVVSSPGKAEPPPAVSQATQDDIVTGMLNDYTRGAEFSSGTLVNSGASSAYMTGRGVNGATSTTAYYHSVISGFGPLNTINSGITLPVITHKEETKGSRYLIGSPVHGMVVDQTGTIMKDSSYLLNYDKIDGKLLLTTDNKSFLEVDRDKVKAFALKGADTSFVFLNVPLIDNGGSYFILIALGQHYSMYKSVKTKFTKADYQTNGLIEKGNNFDEYADSYSYYIVDYKKNKFWKIELKKKSIKDALAESPTGLQYMNDHKHDDIDEAYLKDLNRSLNAN